ncbi:MAG: hypothetical protein NTW29_08020 [Bacteroidetes bacterium]|nr:hypothetical protein [Bacteroidota bacterium]
MKGSILFWLWLVTIAGCKPGLPESRNSGGLLTNHNSSMIEYGGVKIIVKEMKRCHYPLRDPLFEKKGNKKLVVVRMELYCLENTSRRAIVPDGAILTDSRGNEYEPSPAVIATAQNNRCISGDDISAYNAIWNGNVKKGNSYTAWMLGFELPEDAVPEKLYWNKNWKIDQVYFDFNTTDLTINH